MSMDKISNQSKTNEGEISLKEVVFSVKEYWRYLLSRWIVILTFGLLGGALGLLYSFMKKPVYTATTTFVLETGEKSGMGQYAGIASMMGIDLSSGGGGIFQGDNIIELYKSRTMIEKTLFGTVDSSSNQSLMERFIDMNKWRNGWEKKPELHKLSFRNNDSKALGQKTQRLKDSVVGKAVEAIDKGYLTVIKPDKKLSIIRVDVKAKDEEFAKRFNEELVKNVNDFYVQTKTKKSIDNVNILQHKTDSVRAVMNTNIYTAVAVADATPNLNPTRQIQRIAPAQRAQFSAETNRAVLSALVQNLEMAKISLLKETPLVQQVDRPIYPLKENRWGKVKGVAIGGVFFGFLIVMYLTFGYFLKNILSE